MTYRELKAKFCDHEATYPKNHLTGYIVFKKESFDRPYTLDQRTYVVSSDNKAFRPHMGGYSIFADCLDGSDYGVRLEWYMKEEGVKDGWEVDYCYIPQHSFTKVNAQKLLSDERESGSTNYFNGALTLDDMYEMFRDRMQFGEAETNVIMSALILAGCVFSDN